MGPADHVARNRALWDRWSPEWVESGRRAWKQDAITWGMWELPEAEVGAVDVAISEYGAAIWCDPYRWIPEAARLLRPGGELVFLRDGVLRALCAPDSDEPAGDRLLRDSFTAHRLEWSDDGSVNFTLGIGRLIRLFRASGLEVVDCVELQAPADGRVRFPYITAAWAHRWPSEEIWRVKKRD